MFYPNLCSGCKTPLTTGQEILCVACRMQLPYIAYDSAVDNVVAKSFRGRTEIGFALSLLYFQKQSIVQNLLHELKYKGNKEIGEILGRELTALLEKLDTLNQFEAIVPVPLHTSKLKQRGYNQAEIIAAQISNVTGKPLLTELLRKEFSALSQTKKGRFERWQNSSEMFVCSSESPKKSLLLVDDVITSGATVEACINSIQNKNPDIVISVASLAFTYR